MIVTAIYAIQQTEIGISCWVFLLLTSPMSAMKKRLQEIYCCNTRNRILCEFESNMSCQNIQASCNIIPFINVKGLFWYDSGTYMNGLNVKPCAHLSQVFILLLANKVILSTIRRAGLGNQQINRLHKGVGLFFVV